MGQSTSFVDQLLQAYWHSFGGDVVSCGLQLQLLLLLFQVQKVAGAHAYARSASKNDAALVFHQWIGLGLRILRRCYPPHHSEAANVISVY